LISEPSGDPERHQGIEFDGDPASIFLESDPFV
jgi:hypothetical protein